MQNEFLFFVSFLLGSIPFSILLSKILKLPDPRLSGSGNIGVSNVLRTSNNYLFTFLVAFLDISKGIAACFLGSYVDSSFLAGCFALLGNTFSLFPKSSGKGVSILLGILIYHNWYNLLLLPIWFIVSKKTYPAIASFMILLVGFIYILLGIWPFYMIYILIWIIYKHKDNIFRLLTHKEKTLKRDN